MKSIQTDGRGGVPRGEVRLWFGEYGVPKKAADQLFDRLDTFGESTIDIRALKAVLSDSIAESADSPSKDNLKGRTPTRSSRAKRAMGRSDTRRADGSSGQTATNCEKAASKDSERD